MPPLINLRSDGVISRARSILFRSVPKYTSLGLYADSTICYPHIMTYCRDMKMAFPLRMEQRKWLDSSTHYQKFDRVTGKSHYTYWRNCRFSCKFFYSKNSSVLGLLLFLFFVFLGGTIRVQHEHTHWQHIGLFDIWSWNVVGLRNPPCYSHQIWRDILIVWSEFAACLNRTGPIS